MAGSSRDGTPSNYQGEKDATVLILGGGVSGIITAKTLQENGVRDIKMIEACDELGGRLRTKQFGGVNVEVRVPPNSSLSRHRRYPLQAGASWVQGAGDGNPIWESVQRHGVDTRISSFHDYSKIGKRCNYNCLALVGS